MQLTVEDVAFSYGRITIFEDVNFVVRSRRLTALVGPSGTGKSTMLGLLSGLLMPGRGQVRWSQNHRGNAPPNTSETAWIPQGSQAVPGRSTLDNASLGALADGHERSIAEELATQALEVVGLGERQRSLAKQLSGGELQRLAVARVMTGSRSLVLADEPTANLDRSNAQGIAQAVAQLSSDRTVVVATHDPVMWEVADDVIEL